jgi:hypothetical protein
VTERFSFLLHTTKGRVLLGLVVVVVAAAAAFLVAQASGGGSGNTNFTSLGSFGDVTQPELDTAVQGLCEVRTDLQRGDHDAAKTVFYDKAHLFLHQLAAQVQDKDVDQATSLLVAKYKVESLLLLPPETTPSATGSNGSPDALVADLLDQVQKSAAVIGFTAPDCSQ